MVWLCEKDVWGGEYQIRRSDGIPWQRVERHSEDDVIVSSTRRHGEKIYQKICEKIQISGD